jgi:hypothetical protein
VSWALARNPGARTGAGLGGGSGSDGEEGWGAPDDLSPGLVPPGFLQDAEVFEHRQLDQFWVAGCDRMGGALVDLDGETGLVFQGNRMACEREALLEGLHKGDKRRVVGRARDRG